MLSHELMTLKNLRFNLAGAAQSVWYTRCGCVIYIAPFQYEHYSFRGGHATWTYVRDCTRWNQCATVLVRNLHSANRLITRYGHNRFGYKSINDMGFSYAIGNNINPFIIIHRVLIKP